ncbi:MAG TPA: M55 family metallopeptidase [Chloroflexota bacterium]|nr:M55 family metallopeptidase [Chloroflexota bacterium]
MKIYMLTDLEGVAMVSRFDQTGRDGDSPAKHLAMKLLTAEVNAAVDGILDVDSSAEVIVLDGHGVGGIDVMEFHPGAKLISRGPIRPPYYLDSSFDALFVVGQHAKAGTPNGNLCHSYSSKTIEYVKLNGIEVGEFGAWAFLAGVLGVPAVFISGDDLAVAEARELVPGIFGVAVKQSLGYELALHLSPQRSRQRIRETAAEACRHIETIKPLKLDPPYELEIRRLLGQPQPRVLPAGARELDSRTVLYTAEQIWDLPV